MSSSLEDDWVEVSDAPTDFDAEDGRMLSSLAASSNHCGAVANETEEADTPPEAIAVLASSKESAVSCDSHCSDPVETPIQSQICTSKLSTPSTNELQSVVPDERDAEIAQLKSRVQAMETGIRALHTVMISNPGIRRTIKSANSTSNGAEGSTSSCLAVADELTDDVGYELTEVLEATKKLGVALTTHTPQFPKLSFLNFEVGDIVLFMPALVNGQQIWMAFNSGQPNYFLSEESLHAFENRRKQRRTSIIGKLIYMDKRVADADETTYNLPRGSEYHVCYVEPLYRSDLPSTASKTH